MLFKKENENQRKAYKKHQMGKYTKRSEGGHGHVGVGLGIGMMLIVLRPHKADHHV